MNADVTECCVEVPPVAAATPVVEIEATLPGWLAPLLLAGLAIFSGLIVMVGWLIVGLFQTAAPVARVPIRTTVVVALPTPITQPAPIIKAEMTVIEDEPLTERPIALPRRMPSRVEEPMAIPMALPMGQPSNDLAVERVIAPLTWTTEPPSTGGALLPIETARVEVGGIPHNVRRLRLDDEAPKVLKLAITPVMHDDLGSLLTNMGAGYAHTVIRNEDLPALATLKKYDVVFLTCADMYARDFQSAGTLRRFVQEGGTLYASDLRGDLVLAAFPEFRTRVPVLPGVPQNVEASVLDPGLQSYLGRKTIPLTFEADSWRPAAFDATKVTVCLKALYRNQLGQTKEAPLLVKFRVQKGTVIFTSFHHAKNDGPIVRKLLDYLIFATVSVRSEARIRDLMARSQFTPREIRPMLLTANQKIAAAYPHVGGRLQMAVGFEHLGAKLKLALCSPTGQTIECEIQGIYQIDVPNAEPGVWQYTLTPLVLPHANFPVLAAIGGIKS